jgi:FMN phosphatase YigB (HAD superfamily)
MRVLSPRAVVISHTALMGPAVAHHPTGADLARTLAEHGFALPTAAQRTFDRAWPIQALLGSNDTVPELIGWLLDAYTLVCGVDAHQITEELFARMGQPPVSEESVRVVQQLHSLGLRTAVAAASCRPARQHVESLAAAGLGFTDLVTSTEVGAAPPTPTFYRRATDQLGVPPQQVVWVGTDPYFDVAGPRLAGMHAIHLTHHPVTSDIAQRIGAHTTIARWEELTDLLVVPRSPVQPCPTPHARELAPGALAP